MRLRWIPLATALVVLGSAPAHARCQAGYVVAMPHAGTLPANAQVVLEGNGRSAAWVEFMQSATLVAPGHSVPMTAGEHLRSGSAAQVVLIASKPLLVGKKYTLQAPRMGQDERMSLLDSAWTAVEPDDDAPVWKAAPKITGLDEIKLGCGPDTHLKVEIPVDEKSALLVRASVEGGSTFFVMTVAGVASLGHSMCGGPWTPEPDRHYAIKLVAVDAAGHEAAAPGNALAVDTQGGDAGTQLARAVAPAVASSAPPLPTVAPIAAPSATASGGCTMATGTSPSFVSWLALMLLARRKPTDQVRSG